MAKELYKGFLVLVHEQVFDMKTKAVTNKLDMTRVLLGEESHV